MNSLEIKEQIAFIDEAIEELEEQRAEFVEMLAVAPDLVHELWDGPDENGGYRFVPHVELLAEFHAYGDRGQQYTAKVSNLLNTIWLVAMEGTEPTENLLYNFGKAKEHRVMLPGADLTTWVPEDSEGNKLRGYRVLWHGNLDWHDSREWFEDHWADPEVVEKYKRQSSLALRSLDAEYRRLRKNPFMLDYFLRRHPEYEPPED
jgi:hypothetical protein